MVIKAHMNGYKKVILAVTMMLLLELKLQALFFSPYYHLEWKVHNQWNWPITKGASPFLAFILRLLCNILNSYIVRNQITLEAHNRILLKWHCVGIAAVTRENVVDTHGIFSVPTNSKDIVIWKNGFITMNFESRNLLTRM